MSEYARAVLEMPVSAERKRAEREANRVFKNNMAKFKAAIMQAEGLPLNYRVVGYHIADLVNFKTGYAWPSQKFLAAKIPCKLRTVQRAVARLVDEETGWFRREVDSRNNCYFPRFERLNEPQDTRHNSRHFRPSDTRHYGGKSGGLSSSIDPIEREILMSRGASEYATDHPQPISQHDGTKADRLKDGVVPFGDQDEIITELARKDGKPHFVFQDSEPWQCWESHLAAEGMPPMVPRRHMVKGVWRTGCDMPSLYPPGYSKFEAPARDRQEQHSAGPPIECSSYLADNIRRRGVQSPANQLQNKFAHGREPK